jgi:[ribosomal protein S18]-alanine N-acetyltransferase
MTMINPASLNLFGTLDGSQPRQIGFHRVSQEWERPLAEFFVTIVRSGSDRSFHPHPLDAAEAHRRASYTGCDEYHLAEHQRSIVAYGMLRGWEDGFETPSLGIAVHPEWQGQGIGRRMMVYLHEVARARGSKRIRLRVYPENEVAIRLYESLGYIFAGDERGQRLGVLTL